LRDHCHGGILYSANLGTGKASGVWVFRFPEKIGRCLSKNTLYPLPA
jgi:hypothetical protein